jgi:hypothetical protein
MMRHTRTWIGLAAGVAACVLGVGAASAAAAGFESTGGTTKGLSVTKNEEFQVWPMTVVCPKAVTKGSIAAGLTETFTTEVKYSSCTTFGGALKVTVSAGSFVYNANGIVAITAPITITPSILKCHYVIPLQAGFAKESVLFSDVTDFGANVKKFPNGQSKIQVQSLLTGMHYTAVGWPCTGPKNAEEHKEGKETEEEGEEGKFSGKIEEEVVGGNLTWLKE